MKKRCHDLAHRICAHFESGIHPDTGLRHYINSTFSNPGSNDLKQLLTDNENCESESLIELIFFPDTAIQTRLEKCLEKGCYTKDDETLTHRVLMGKNPFTTLFFPDHESPIRFDTPRSGARQFIARLNIHKKPDARLNEIMANHLSKHERDLCKVMIRNAAFECKSEKARFLRHFVLKMNLRGEHFLAGFKFALSVLETCPLHSSPRETFYALKKTHLEAIRRADQFKNLAKGHNIETLILQGIRIPHFDTADDMQKVSMIDDIGLAIYGETV